MQLPKDTDINGLPEAAEMPNLDRALVLQEYFPDLDVEKTAAYLSRLSDADRQRLQIGSFGSLAFDLVFSPEIIPKRRHPDYRRVYSEYFQKIHNIEVFEENGDFTFQKEEDFYRDHNGPNSPLFLSDWIADLRAVHLMMTRFHVDLNMHNLFTRNLAEAALCRMAENGEEWPDDLFYELPTREQERLEHLRTEISTARKNGLVLAPGQFFRIANQLEFEEHAFFRGSTHHRASMVIAKVTENGLSLNKGSFILPPAPETLQFEPGVNWQRPSSRQMRQVNLSSLIRNYQDAQKFTNVLLATSRTGSLPPLRME